MRGGRAANAVPPLRSHETAQARVLVEVRDPPAVALDDDEAPSVPLLADPCGGQTTGVDLLHHPDAQLVDPVLGVVRRRVEPGLRRTARRQRDAQPAVQGRAVAGADVDHADVDGAALDGAALDGVVRGKDVRDPEGVLTDPALTRSGGVSQRRDDRLVREARCGGDGRFVGHPVEPGRGADVTASRFRIEAGGW